MLRISRRISGVPCLFVIVVILLSSLSQCEIVTAPSDAVTVPGGIATFKCLVNGQGYWTVNRADPSGISGFTVSIVEEQTDSGSVVTIMNLTAVGHVAYNASRVQCHGIDELGTATERSAYLIIAGPPLAPRPHLAILNSTALLVSWDKPFTWVQVADILNYTVAMRNGSGPPLMEWIITPSSSNETISVIIISSNGSVAETCMELTFVVSANNSIGQSQSTSVSGGFPIDITWNNESLSAITVTSLEYDSKGLVSIVTNILPPKMCPYQSANFTIKITTADRSGILASATVARSFNNSTPFEVQLVFSPLAKQRTYFIILHVASAIGLLEQEATEKIELRQTVEPTPSMTSSSFSINGTGITLLLVSMCVLYTFTSIS